MHKTRSKPNGDNELYTPHNGWPRAFSRSTPYFLYLLTYFLALIVLPVAVSFVAEWALYSNHAAGSEKENNNASELRTEDVFHLGGGGRFPMPGFKGEFS